MYRIDASAPLSEPTPKAGAAEAAAATKAAAARVHAEDVVRVHSATATAAARARVAVDLIERLAIVPALIFWLSERISKASPIYLNLISISAFSSSDAPEWRSGWYCNAIFLYAFLISWSEARRVTPSILYRHLRPAFFCSILAFRSCSLMFPM